MGKIPSYKIEMPVTGKDYREIVEIIDQNMLFDENWRESYFKKFSVGEILIIKDKGRVIAVLIQHRPGKIFDEISEDHFVLEKYKVKKKDIGYIAVVIVDPKFRRKGIARMLVSEAMECQNKFGSKVIAVHCWQKSPGLASQKIFGSFGFKPIKLHKRLCYEHSKKVGPKGYICANCGNPCKCDDLEMMHTF